MKVAILHLVASVVAAVIAAVASVAVAIIVTFGPPAAAALGVSGGVTDFTSWTHPAGNPPGP